MRRGIRIRFLFMVIFSQLRCKKCGYVKKTEKILTLYATFVFSQPAIHSIVGRQCEDSGREENEKDSICGNWVSAQPHL